MVTLGAIVQTTLMNRPLTYATDTELTKLHRRYAQLADTFHATDPTTGVDVFKALDHIAAERRKRL